MVSRPNYGDRQGNKETLDSKLESKLNLKSLPHDTSTMARLKCVECGHSWESPLDRRYPRCGVCLSYDVIEEADYKGILSQCDQVDPEQGLLRVAVLKAIIKERGFKFKPAATLSLVEAVLNKAFPEQPAGWTVLADGSIYYQMKRVKRDSGKDAAGGDMIVR